MQEDKPVLFGGKIYQDGVELFGEEADKALDRLFPYTYTTPNGNVVHSMWPEDDPRRADK